MKKEKENILNNYVKDITTEIIFNVNNCVLYHKRGKAFFKLRKYDYALADYDRAIEIKPMYTNAYINRAKAKAKLYDYKGAVDDVFTYFQLEGLNDER